MKTARSLTVLATLVFLLAVPLTAVANHYANHTCGIFPRNPEDRTAGVGFGTPGVAGVPATDSVTFEGVCLSLDTHEPFTAFVEVTFQWLERGVWQDVATIRCSARSSGTDIQSVVVSAPGECPTTHTYAAGHPSLGHQHRAVIRLTTDVRNGPVQVGTTAPWSTSQARSPRS